MRGRELAGDVEAAFRATRAAVLDAWRQPATDVRMKPDRTVVTDLDRRLEERLGAALLELDAACGLVGEESGVLREGTPTWHLDPVDGTLNFARRISVFASQAVLLDGERPVFAAIYEPLQDDFAWAAHGEGAWREGRRMGVADRALEDAVVLLDVSKSGVFARRPDVLPRLRRAVYRVRALGSVGIQLRDVAAGSADAFVGSRANPSPLHDVAPGALLVREAGGIATDLAGGDALRDRRSLVAASPGVHAALCALVGG